MISDYKYMDNNPFDYTKHQSEHENTIADLTNNRNINISVRLFEDFVIASFFSSYNGFFS